MQSISVGGFSSRSQYQFSLQSADIEALRAAGAKVEERMRSIPGILDVSSDQQIKARDAVVEIDRGGRVSLGLTIGDIREHALRRLWHAAGLDHLCAGGHLCGDPRGGQEVRLDRRDAAQADDQSGKRHDDTSRQRRPRRHQAVGALRLAYRPAARRDGLLQSAPGVAFGEAVDRIQAAVAELTCQRPIQTSFQGAAQQFQSTVRNTGLLIFAAILVVYIVLGILYESFIHPLTILSGLPSAGIGALITLDLFGMDCR